MTEKNGHSEDFSFDDGIVLDENTQKEIEKAPTGIEKSVEEKLSKEELKQIEENKKKHKEEKKKAEPKQQKTLEEELEYDKDELSDEELKSSMELQGDLVGFLKEKVDIEENTGVKFLLPTGIDILDTVAGGGFAAGAVTLIVGNPGTFKSALLGQTIGTNQKKYKGRVLNVFMDSEEAMTKQRLINLGVKNPPVKPHPAKSVEDVFKTIEAICAFKELKKLQDNPSIIAWDSIANTITEKEKESTELDINKFIGLKARVISILLPKYVSKLEQYNIGLIVVNQLREKIDMGFFPTANDLRWIGDKNMPGGNALKYNAFHMLLLKIKGDLKIDEWGFNGVLIEAKFVKNKLFSPNIVIELIVDFNTGVSNFWTNWNLLVKNKRASNAAGWAKLISLPDVKCRRKDVKEQYRTNIKFKEEFDNQVKDVLQKEYIDKYSDESLVEEVENKLETIREQK